MEGTSSAPASDQRFKVSTENRQRIIQRIYDTLLKTVCLPQELSELKNIALRFEEKCYSSATSQEDYLRKISIKLLSVEANISQNGAEARLSSTNPAAGNQSHGISGTEMKESIATKVHGPTGSSIVKSETEKQGQPSGPSQSTIPSVSQTCNLQITSEALQNSVNTTSGQCVTPNTYAHAMRQMQGKQQEQQTQQHHQSQNSLIYQKQCQQHLLNQNFPHPLHIQLQPQQQSRLHPNQLEPSKQPMMQLTSCFQSVKMEPTMMQSSSPYYRQQNQLNSVPWSLSSLVQQRQSVGRQQQQLMGQQSNISNIQQAQLLGQQNSVTYMQHQQRLHGQQNNLTSIQHAQQVLNQQNFGPQNNILGQQHHPQLLGSLSVHMLQQTEMGAQQQTCNSSLALVKSQAQKSQHQSSQQLLMTEIQSQPSQSVMQQQSNSMQSCIQQQLQASSASLHAHTIEQQKMFIQSHREHSEVSSSMVVDSRVNTTNMSIAEFQEELYQKIKSMKEKYFTELKLLYLRIAHIFQQYDAPPPPGPQLVHYERLKNCKQMMDKCLQVLQTLKGNITLGLKERLPGYENFIVKILASHGSKKIVPSESEGQQQFEQHSRHDQFMAEKQSSQISQMQHDNRINQVQKLYSKDAPASMQSGTAPSMKLGSMDSLAHIKLQTLQQNRTDALRPASNLDPIQETSLGSPQQSGMGSLQNAISEPFSENTLQTNGRCMQPGSNVLQDHNLKLQPQKQQQHLMQTQQIRQQLQQRPMQQSQKQQIFQLSPLHQQKQQPMPHFPVHQGSGLNQMIDGNELKTRQASGVKSELYQQHYSGNQYPNHYQQLKAGTSFLSSSPQNLQTSSPQISPNSSSQIDQHYTSSSLPKDGTPSLSANSPFIVPSPSTPIISSPLGPLPGGPEKLYAISSLPHDANTAHQKTSLAPTQPQSLVVVTPGISPSPLLAEFTAPEASQTIITEANPGDLSSTDRPIAKLIKRVQSLSDATLSSCITDIGSVVRMNECLAGSTHGNGSRSEVGEDLVAMTRCRFQIRRLILQDGSSGKKMKRHTTSMPLNTMSPAGSVNDTCNPVNGLDTSELESTATSNVKRQKTKVNHSLQEEIRGINQGLIDMVVDIAKDGDDIASADGVGEGTVVKCTFTPVAFSADLKLQLSSVPTCRIVPLRLLLPSNYPDSSPLILDELPNELNEEIEDLSVKALSRFDRSLHCLSNSMSLGEMVRAWDSSVHQVIIEYAKQFGGGSFSTTYGVWENCESS